MDKVAVTETEKKVALGNNSILIVQNTSSTPLEWSHEPNSTEVFKLYPGDMLKVNYDIWIRNSSHGDDYVVTHSFGATESVGADESGVSTSFVNPFFSSAAQHSNSFNLNFNHANKKSHKITCSSNGRGFTFDEEGVYKFVLYTRYMNVDATVPVGLAFFPPSNTDGGQLTETGLLYQTRTPDEVAAYNIILPIALPTPTIQGVPDIPPAPRREILDFKPIPVLAGTTIILVVGTVVATSAASVGFVGGDRDFLSIHKL